MSELDYTGQTRAARLRGWILTEMLRGAGYAGGVVLAVGLIIATIWAISLFLPEESKNAPPPMPFSQMQAPADMRTG